MNGQPLTPEEARALLAGQPATADGSITVAPLAPVPGANSYGQPTAGPSYNMSAEEAAHYLANADPTMSTAEDVGRSSVTGLQQGVAGLLGTPGDLLNLWDRGQTYLLDKSIQGAQDLTHTNLGLPHHLTNADVSQELNEVSRAQEIPTSNDLNTGIQHFAGPYHVPQTALGRYAQRGAQFAPMLFGGDGGLLAKGATWLGSSGGSQFAEDIAPEKYKPLAALAGAVAGGGPGAIWQAADAAPARAWARGMEGLTPGDLAGGAQLRPDSAAGPGMKLSVPESISQASGGKGAGLLALQHFVENTPAGRRLLGDFFSKERPEQVGRAIQWLGDQFGPPDTKPAATALANKAAAGGVINQIRQDINAGTEGDYAALNGQSLPPDAYGQLAKNPSYTAALSDVRGNAELSPLVPGPDNDLNTVMKVYQRLGEMADDATPNPLKGGSFTLASQREQARMLADKLARDFAPEWGQALDKQAEQRANLLEPAQNGPVGRISQADTIPSQVSALMPRSPPEGTAVETAAAAQALPPEVTTNLIRHNIIDTGNEAQRDLVQGITNPYAGSRFARMIAGNSEQEAALTAGVNALDPTGDKAGNLALALDAFRATGRREATGSKTAFNEQMRTELGMSPMPIRAAGGLLDPLEWGRHIDKAVGGALYRKTVERLSAALMGEDPQMLAQAQRFQSVNPIVVGLLAGPRKGP